MRTRPVSRFVPSHQERRSTLALSARRGRSGVADAVLVEDRLCSARFDALALSASDRCATVFSATRKAWAIDRQGDAAADDLVCRDRAELSDRPDAGKSRGPL